MSGRRRKRGSREIIDPRRAIELFEQLGSWEKVSRAMPRRSGQRFQPLSIAKAVIMFDKPPDPLLVRLERYHG